MNALERNLFLMLCKIRFAFYNPFFYVKQQENISDSSRLKEKSASLRIHRRAENKASSPDTLQRAAVRERLLVQ